MVKLQDQYTTGCILCQIQKIFKILKVISLFYINFLDQIHDVISKKYSCINGQGYLGVRITPNGMAGVLFWLVSGSDFPIGRIQSKQDSSNCRKCQLWHYWHFFLFEHSLSNYR